VHVRHASAAAVLQRGLEPLQTPTLEYGGAPSVVVRTRDVSALERSERPKAREAHHLGSQSVRVTSAMNLVLSACAWSLRFEWTSFHLILPAHTRSVLIGVRPREG
jgi:hypothetical protein